MKKKTDSSSSSSSEKKKKTIYGFEFTQNDGVTSLIGGIVEKGFNQPLSPSQPPKATVLPFPVARHRSHGPHWGPTSSGLSTRGKAEEEEEEEEEEDEADENYAMFDKVAAGAVPVKRKQKKGLDLKRWKDIVNADQADEFRNKAQKPNGSGRPSNVKKDLNGKKSDVVKNSEHNIGVGIDDVQSNIDYGMRSAVKAKKASFDSVSVGVGVEQGSTSIESEIDAENRARLEKMSTDEIAEAQAELMKKMDPALIKILQKRGQDKTRKNTSTSSKTSISSNSSISSAVIGSFAESNDNTVEKVSTGDNVKNMIMADPNHKRIGLESKDMPEKKSSGSLWDAWSTNVEAARDLRFSLDGDVINDHGPVPGRVENASERDFLRTEGDPGALGYTIKEALALTRSVVPGQRALALHLIESVLYKAQENICGNQTGSTLKVDNQNQIVDWEALWAFALGPEPELALHLRLCIDDNHNSVVIACARVIQCVLSYDFNELFFDISEKTGIYEKDVCTAPIFRSRPKIEVGFLHGGFWKYNTKPSNILPFEKIMRDDEAEEHTVKDDVVVATQDIAAGLVRMGILPRIRYLLESNPSAALEECLLSILVAIAMHSPTCAEAIIKCERLLQVIIHRFTTKDQMGVDHSKIKSIILMKVLARSDRKRCMEFVNSGTFQKLLSHLYRCAFSLDNFLNVEKEKFKLLSALLVEQLRLWKVGIQYGFCVSHFSDLFPALYNWLDVPALEKLIEKNILHEFTAITKEAYLVLKALTKTLPNFYSQKVDHNDTDTWRWSNAGPMIDLALKWVSLKSDESLSSIFLVSNGTKKEGVTSILWVISAVTHFLVGVLKSVIPDDNSSIQGGNLPWLPEFVPKVGLHIIKNGLLSFTQGNEHSFLEFLCQCRPQSDQETSLASVCCLDELVEVVHSVNSLIQLANTKIAVSSIELKCAKC